MPGTLLKTLCILTHFVTYKTLGDRHYYLIIACRWKLEGSISDSLAPESMHSGVSEFSEHVSYGYYFLGFFFPCVRASILNLLMNLFEVHLESSIRQFYF